MTFRVAQVTSVHHWADVRIFHHYCKTLASNGFQVTLVAPDAPEHSDEDVRLISANVGTGKIRRILTSSFRIGHQIRKMEFDVVHVHDPELIPLALYLTSRRQTVVLDVHESLRADLATKEYLGWLSRPIAFFVDRLQSFVARRVSATVVATPDIAIELGEDLVTVVANYPDLGEFAPAATATREEFVARGPSVGYAGDLTRLRCVPEMIRAAELVRIPDFQFLIAGRASEITPENTESVRYLGLVDRHGVVDLLRSIQVGLCVLGSHPNYENARPIKVFEYLAAGVPVIVARTTRWAAEFVEANDCGIVVDAPEPELISEAMDQMLRDPERSYEMGQNGYRVVTSEYTWASQGRVLVALYEDLAHETVHT